MIIMMRNSNIKSVLFFFLFQIITKNNYYKKYIKKKFLVFEKRNWYAAKYIYFCKKLLIIKNLPLQLKICIVLSIIMKSNTSNNLSYEN